MSGCGALLFRDEFPTLTSPFGGQPEALQKDPGTWKETLRPHLASYLQILVEDGRVYCLPAPLLDAKRSEDHLKRCVDEAQIQRQNVREINWKKVVKTLKLNPTSASKNTSVRQFYKAEGHMFLVKFGFTFGHVIVNPGTQHVYQMSQVPMMCFHLPTTNPVPDCKSPVNLTRRNFTASDQSYYVSYIFRPHENYTVPPGTRYLTVAVQKTMFSLQVIPDTIQLSPTKYLPFASHKEFKSIYNIPPPTPQHAGSGMTLTYSSAESLNSSVSDESNMTVDSNKANYTLMELSAICLDQYEPWLQPPQESTVVDRESENVFTQQPSERLTYMSWLQLPQENTVVDRESENVFTQQPSERLTAATSSWPFKTDFVTNPWEMNPRVLVPIKESLFLQIQNKPISPAHVTKVSHRDHLYYSLGDVYALRDDGSIATPMDLSLKWSSEIAESIPRLLCQLDS